MRRKKLDYFFDLFNFIWCFTIFCASEESGQRWRIYSDSSAIYYYPFIILLILNFDKLDPFFLGISISVRGRNDVKKIPRKKYRKFSVQDLISFPADERETEFGLVEALNVYFMKHGENEIMWELKM